jgi:hypothetical protein
MGGNIQEIWQMDKFKSLRGDFLSYIVSVELAAEK